MLVLDTVENRRRVKCHAFDRVENTDPGVTDLVGRGSNRLPHRRRPSTLGML